MKEFISAVEQVEVEDEREDKILALMKPVEEGGKGLTREKAEAEIDRGVPVEFSLDGRMMLAYPPSSGQLIFLMASMGRGQTNEGRLASIVNVMLESLDGSDKDYFESRLLSSKKKDQIDPSIIEGIFEYLTEGWFGNARPTQPASISASSPQTDGQN